LSIPAVQACLDLGNDVNAADKDGRTAFIGAAHKGRNDVIELLVKAGAKMDALDNGSRATVNGELLGHKWMAMDYADGLVRVGVQAAIPHPETAVLLRKLMKEAGLPVPPRLHGSAAMIQLPSCQPCPNPKSGILWTRVLPIRSGDRYPPPRRPDKTGFLDRLELSSTPIPGAHRLH